MVIQLIAVFAIVVFWICSSIDWSMESSKIIAMMPK
jgi:hypothetical protein